MKAAPPPNLSDFLVSLNHSPPQGFVDVTPSNPLSWCLDHVTVTSGRTGEKLIFPSGEWIDKKKGNKKLWRELYPVGREPVPLEEEEEEEEG